MDGLEIHQAVHGYREGHRLLRSSLRFAAEASRALLLMSDMSGPSMQSGFEEYLTGYPLRSTPWYVLAKTWHAPEMDRPGCVWTHSLLIRRDSLDEVGSGTNLLKLFRRPSAGDRVGTSLIEPIMLDLAPSSALGEPTPPDCVRQFDVECATAAVAALYGDVCAPVLILGETAEQFEELVLSLWSHQWPKLRAEFSLCTGALAPRQCSEAVLDLQVVPRKLSRSRYRKTYADATVIDPLSDAAPHSASRWVELLVSDLSGTPVPGFRHWLRECGAQESSRSLVGKLTRVFAFWEQHQPVEPADLMRTVDSELGDSHLHPGTVSRLLTEVFTLCGGDDREAGELSVLEALSTGVAGELFSVAINEIEDRAQCLFLASRQARRTMLQRLLPSRLSPVGERILKRLLVCLDISDALHISTTRPELLPTLVHANPTLASSPCLWSQTSVDRLELVSALRDADSLTPSVMRAVVDAIMASRAEDLADHLLQEVGDMAVHAVLDAARSEMPDVRWKWRTALARHPKAVVSWLERDATDEADFALVAGLLDPNDGAIQEGCRRLWSALLQGARIHDTHDPVVAAFGLALGFRERGIGPFLIGFFQDAFDALEANTLDHAAWRWLKGHAPPLSWWRDWDKCERIAAAIAKRALDHDASPADLIGAVRSEAALRHVVSALRRRRSGRQYLAALREACDTDPSLGSASHRRVLSIGVGN